MGFTLSRRFWKILIVPQILTLNSKCVKLISIPSSILILSCDFSCHFFSYCLFYLLIFLLFLSVMYFLSFFFFFFFFYHLPKVGLFHNCDTTKTVLFICFSSSYQELPSYLFSYAWYVDSFSEFSQKHKEIIYYINSYTFKLLIICNTFVFL